MASPHPLSLVGLVPIGLVEMEIMEFVVSVPIPIPITMLRFQCRGLQMALFISLIKVEHPLKTSNKKAHV